MLFNSGMLQNGQINLLKGYIWCLRWLAAFPLRRPIAPTYHDFHNTVNPNVRSTAIVSEDKTVTEESQ